MTTSEIGFEMVVQMSVVQRWSAAQISSGTNSQPFPVPLDKFAYSVQFSWLFTENKQQREQIAKLPPLILKTKSDFHVECLLCTAHLVPSSCV